MSDYNPTTSPTQESNPSDAVPPPAEITKPEESKPSTGFAGCCLPIFGFPSCPRPLENRCDNKN